MLLFTCSTVTAQNYYQKGAQKLSNQPMYILPKAVLSIDMQVVKIEYKMGDQFKKYTDDQLKTFVFRYGIDPDVYKKLRDKGNYETASFSEDSLKISTIAAADYSKIYYIDPKVKWNKDLSVVFTYGEDGILTEGESGLQDKTLEMVAKGLSAVATVARGFALLDAHATPPAGYVEQLETELKNFTKLEDQMDYQIYKDLKSTIEKNYGKVFAEYFYTTKKTITKVKIYFTPNEKDESREIALFSVSSKGDVVIDKKYMQNDQVWGKKFKFDHLDSTKAYKLSFKKIGAQRADHHHKREASDLGFAYNIPAVVEMKLTDPKNEIIYQELAKIPQFGIVGFVSQHKGKLTYSLNPITGELKKLVIDKKGISGDQITGIATSSEELIKAIKGDSYDKKLQDEVTRLENEKKKRDLLRELGIEQ
jgi:hypothetical protein